MSEQVPEFDPFVPFRPERAEADREVLRILRGSCPVKHQPDGSWLVTTADGGRQVLERIDDFGGTFGNYEGVDVDDIILPAIPEPLHSLVRRGVNASVAYHRSITVEPFLRDLVTRLLGEAFTECEARGSVDLYQVVLLPVPASAIAHLLGVPAEDRPLFTRWGDELIERQLDGDNFNKPVAELHPEFAAYLDAHIARRRAEGLTGDDSVSRMIREGERGDYPMSDRMIRTQLMNLLVAGNETTRNLLGSLFYLLAADPDLEQRVRANRELVPNLIEEVLRLEPPVRFLVRRCSHDTTLQDAAVEQGATMLVSFEGVNRDERAIDRPDELDLNRENPRDHISFGSGAHICPGAFLARLEAQVVLETYLDLVATMRLADGAVYEPHPVYWARGPISLRVVLEAAGSA